MQQRAGLLFLAKTTGRVLLILEDSKWTVPTFPRKDTLINELENEIDDYRKLHATDTLYSNLQKQEILFYQRQVENYKDLYKVSKPKWYNSKIIWFGLGFGTVMGSSWVVKNVK